MTLKEIKHKLEEMVPEFAAKVAPIYQLLKWEWSPGKSRPHIPSIGEIENTLYGLIEGLTDEYNDKGTGGISAYYNFPDDVEFGHYGLAFTVESDTAFD